MGDHLKELREFLLQAKPIDLSKRPAIVTLPQRETYTLLLLSLPLLIFLLYEFFSEWREGQLAYEYLALAGMNLYWGFSQLSKLLNRYEITIGTDEVNFSRTRFFSVVESWKTPLSQYQTLQIICIEGDKPVDSMYSVELVHPDSAKILPLAASRQEVIARGQLDQLRIALSLPVIDKVSARPKFSRTEKTAMNSFLKSPGAALLILMVGLPMGILSWYFWTMTTSPMDTVACTIVAREITEVEEPRVDGRNTLLTTRYHYVYKGQSYESRSKIGHYENTEKMQRRLSKSPEGSQTHCFVDSRDPSRVFEYPLSKTYWDWTIYMTGGLAIVGLLLVIWTQFPFGFRQKSQTKSERITQTSMKNKVKRRYRQTILELKALGFQGYCFYKEIMSPFSLLPGFQIFLMMLWKREVISIRFPLRMVLGFPLLVFPNQGTYAMTHGLETKFLTLFSDGTALVTGTEGQIPIFVDEENKIYRQGRTQTVESAWKQHQDRVALFRTEGKHVTSEIHFEDFVDIETRTEKIILDNHLFQGA